jgi:hypothetical protein
MLRYLGCVAAISAPVIFLAGAAAGQAVPTTAPTVVVAGAALSPDRTAIKAAPVALSLEELSEEHGRQGVYIHADSTQALNAVNSGNSITAGQVGSGDIALTEGAFAGFAGIGNFVINTGHNNNLQGSLSIMIVTP